MDGFSEIDDFPVQRREVTSVLKEEDVRAIALREAIAYFSYVNMSRTAAAPGPPVGARTVLGMADHFVAYITTGKHPAPDKNGGES